jgi:Transposase domain (DUF772)
VALILAVSAQMHGHVRLMVGLLLLKQMYDQSDEDVVDRWVENPYWQQFSAVGDFESKLPEQSDSALVYIRCGHKKEIPKRKKNR